MKIQKLEEGFVPIVIYLQTKEESECLWSALQMVIAHRNLLPSSSRLNTHTLPIILELEEKLRQLL